MVRPHAFLSFCMLLLILGGCSMPRLIVLNDPLNAEQHNDLGVAYEGRGDYELAVREYRRAAELAEDWPLPLFNLGNVHARSGDWQAAAEAYRQALARDAEMTDAQNNLAWVLVENGQAPAAVEHAERAVALQPANPWYRDTLAAALLAAGRPLAADRQARQGLALSPPAELKLSLQAKLLNSAHPNLTGDGS